MPYQRIQRPQVRTAQRGQPPGQRDKQNLKPLNERLWNMLTIQAKAKFVKYPSPTASAWVHNKYLEMGGRFVDTVQETRRKKAVQAAKEIAKKNHEAHSRGKKAKKK